jgi:hypothetical protein
LHGLLKIPREQKFFAELSYKKATACLPGIAKYALRAIPPYGLGCGHRYVIGEKKLTGGKDTGGVGLSAIL